jgi:hypothetical protein
VGSFLQHRSAATIADAYQRGLRRLITLLADATILTSLRLVNLCDDVFVAVGSMQRLQSTLQQLRQFDFDYFKTVVDVSRT